MKKRVVYLCIGLLITIFLTACATNNTAQQPDGNNVPENQVTSEPNDEETTAPDNQDTSESEENTQPQTPTPPPIPEITEDEMLRQFETIYTNCGADITQSEENLAVELETLQNTVADSAVSWPDDYREQYRSWRARIVAAWKNGLYKSYWDIISQRKTYTYGKSGLVYADYINPDENGTPQLVLVSWAPGENYDQIITLELYGEENGKAVAMWKKDITVASFAPSAQISLATRDNQLFLRVSYYLQSSVEIQERDEFYALSRENSGAVEKLSSRYDRLSDMVEYYKGDSQITEGEYQAQLAAYHAGEKIIELNRLYEEEFPHIDTDGILSARSEVDAEIEVNGTVVKLSALPYAYGNPYASNNVMVPLRDVLEAMGVAVYANSDVSVIIASTKEDTLVIANKDYNEDTLVIANKDYNRSQDYNGYYRRFFNGGTLGRVVIERGSDGRLLASLQPLVELFGASVEWDNEAAIIRVTSNIPDNIRMTQSEIETMANFNFDQAVQIAEQAGYTGFSTRGGHPVLFSSYNEYVEGRLIFAYGKAIYIGYILDWEESIEGDGSPGSGSYYGERYRIDVMHDGTIIAHPYDKVYEAAG